MLATCTQLLLKVLASAVKEEKRKKEKEREGRRGEGKGKEGRRQERLSH